MGESLADFLNQWGANSALDRSFLKPYGLDNPDVWSVREDREGPSTWENPATIEKINSLRDYQISPTGEANGRRNYAITGPNGETQTTSLGLSPDTAFDKFMYSGAPIAMMAGGPLAAAFGPMAAGAIVGGGLGAVQEGGDLDLGDIFKGAAIGGIGGGLTQLGLPSAISKPISNLVGNAFGGAGAAAGGLASLIGGNMASETGGATAAPDSGVGSIIDSLLGFLPSGNNLMAALPGLAGMFANYQGQQQTGDMLESLSGMYGQDSPYAQTMRSNLERRDAAAGRRSQYGAREVELQSKLADVSSKRIADMQGMNRDQLLMRNLMMQQGMSGLNSLFGRQPSGQPGTQSGSSLGSALSQLFKGSGSTGSSGIGDLSAMMPALTKSYDDFYKDLPNTNFFNTPGSLFGNSPIPPEQGFQIPAPSWADASAENGFNFDFSGWGD